MNGGNQTSQGAGDLVTTLNENASLAATLGNPDITLARAAATYLLFKRKRLTDASERGYKQILDELTSRHSGAKLSDFEPPRGALLIEDLLAERWGHLEPRTYNKALSVLSDLFSWHVARGTLNRSPVAGIERAKVRPALRTTFTSSQVASILTSNTEPHDQIALRLLLHFGIRKGALLGIRFEHFERERQRLTIFTKGETIHTLPIVDQRIWELLDELAEPDHHYLLCRQVPRKRTSPSRTELVVLFDHLWDVREAIGDVADDACSVALTRLGALLEDCFTQVSVAAATAAVQVRRYPSEPMGEHGGHGWWYRCLTSAAIVAPGTTAGRKMHSARHTAIQAVLDKTGNLKAAQTLAGHKSVGTTGDIYSDWGVQLEGTMRDVLGAA